MKIFITAKTRAKEERIEELDPIHFLVAVKEPPAEGKANAAIIKLLARHFGIPQANVRIIMGHTTKEKVIDFTPHTPDTPRPRASRALRYRV